MPQKVTMLALFASCPKDLSAEPGFNAFDSGMSACIKGGPPKEQVIEVQRMLESVIPTLRSSRDPVINFRDTIAKIPTLTTRLKKAIRATRTQLDELIAGLTIVSDRAVSIEARLKLADNSQS